MFRSGKGEWRKPRLRLKLDSRATENIIVVPPRLPWPSTWVPDSFEVTESEAFFALSFVSFFWTATTNRCWCKAAQKLDNMFILMGRQAQKQRQLLIPHLLSKVYALDNTNGENNIVFTLSPKLGGALSPPARRLFLASPSKLRND